jgi:DNA-directed RNA polymerase subunit RPC12/RpoP
MSLRERDLFTEAAETRVESLACPKCGHRADYNVRWMRRTRKPRLPPGGDARDRALFEKLRDYLVRVDDALACRRCGRRFEIPSHQSIMFLDGGVEAATPEAGARRVGGRRFRVPETPDESA